MKGLLEELSLQIRFWGARGLTRSVHYALLYSLAQLRRRRPRGAFLPVGRAISCQEAASGAMLTFERAELWLEFVRPDILRITWRPGLLPVPYGLANQQWPGAQVALRESGEGWELASERMRVAVGRDGGIEIRDPRGVLLHAELPPERRGDEWRHRSRLRPEERLYGLGEHTGPIDLRGTRRRLWNSDPMASYGPDRSPLYLNIPVYQALHEDGGYLVFFENSFPATMSYGPPAPAGAGGAEASAHFEGGALRYYLVPGAPDHTLEAYTDLTGRPPLPPRWALGYHQSRFSYEDEQDVREVADGFLERDLPLSAIHLDIHYMDGFRVFTVDPERFPDLAGLARDLEGRGVRLVVILDPGVKRDDDYRVYREGLERKMFSFTKGGKVAVGPVWPGWCAFPDFTDERVREWWAGLYSGLVDDGVSGFWNDMNEPTLTALWGERALAHDVEHDFDGRGGEHFEAHNLYGLLMVRSGFEGLKALRPERRPFLLSRSGWAGIQRYAWTWTGDISSQWPMLRQTIATVLGLGLSGVPYSGPDIGGFKGALDDELYLRWFELATFLPFYRTHSALRMGRREPWRFGPHVLERVRGLLELREELMPYLYTLAWQASDTGWPLVRPLFWPDHPGDELRGIDDSFLLGEALLVAPVLEQGARSRRVTLPPGDWYDFWSGTGVEGGAVTAEAPLGRPPLFVRAASVLPLTGRPPAKLDLHLYPAVVDGGMGRDELYSDAGEGYGTSRVDVFTLVSEAGRVTLRWRAEGDFPFPYARVALWLHGRQPRRVRVDGRQPDTDGSGVVVVEPFAEAVFEF